METTTGIHVPAGCGQGGFWKPALKQLVGFLLRRSEAPSAEVGWGCLRDIREMEVVYYYCFYISILEINNLLIVKDITWRSLRGIFISNPGCKHKRPNQRNSHTDFKDEEFVCF